MSKSEIWLLRIKSYSGERESDNKSVRDRETAWACCSRSLCLFVGVHAWERVCVRVREKDKAKAKGRDRGSCMSVRERESVRKGERERARVLLASYRTLPVERRGSSSVSKVSLVLLRERPSTSTSTCCREYARKYTQQTQTQTQTDTSAY